MPRKKLRPLTDPNDRRHGTMNGYGNRGCRCPKCREANAAYTRDLKSRTEPPPPDDPRHGTANCYRNRNCRCDPCRAAGAADRKAQPGRVRQTKKALT